MRARLQNVHMEKPAERVRPETKYAPRGLIPDNTSAEAIFAVRGSRPRAKKKTLSSLPSPRPPKAKLNHLQRQDTVVYPPRPRATNLPTTLTMGKGVRTKVSFISHLPVPLCWSFSCDLASTYVFSDSRQSRSAHARGREGVRVRADNANRNEKMAETRRPLSSLVVPAVVPS